MGRGVPTPTKAINTPGRVLALQAARGDGGRLSIGGVKGPGGLPETPVQVGLGEGAAGRALGGDGLRDPQGGAERGL